MDLIVRLLGQNSGFNTAMAGSRNATYQANQALDRLNASMEAELATEKQSAAQKQILALADRGASAASVEYAMSLANQIEQRHALDAAAAKTAAVVDRLSASLTAEINSLRMSSEEMTRYEAAAAGASAAQLRKIDALQRELVAERNATEALQSMERAENQARQASENLVSTLQRELATFGMTTQEIRRYEAAQAGASAASMKSAAQLEWQIGQQMRFDREIQKQISSQRASQTAMAGGSRSTMMLTESMRALEDGVMGFTNNGLKGMAMGLSNNISMIGSLMGGPWGMGLMIASNAALIGSTLVPMLMKWSSGTDELIKKEKELQEELKRTHDAAMTSLPERARSSYRKQDDEAQTRRLMGDPTTNSSQLKAEMDRIKARETAARREQGIERMQQDELRRRRFSNENEISAARIPGGDPGRSKERIEALEKENQEIERKLQESADRVRILKADEAKASSLRDEVETARVSRVAKEQQEAQIKAAEEERTARSQRDQQHKAQDQKELDEKQRKIAEIDHIERESLGATNPAMAKQLEAYRKFEEDKAKIRSAAESGLITNQRADELTKSSQAAYWKRYDEAAGGSSLEKTTSQQEEKVRRFTEDRQPRNLTAVEANSSEGFRQIFDALGGASSPQRQIAQNSARHLQQAQLQLLELKGLRSAIDKLKPIKTG